MTIKFTEKNRVQVQRSDNLTELIGAVKQLDIASPRPVIVLVGGAGGIKNEHRTLIRQAIQELSDVAEQLGAIMVDGGTESGVMADIGRARSESGHTFPLVGVAVESLVTWPDRLDSIDKKSAAPLDSNHTAFILVAGSNWGDEVPYLARTGTLLAGKRPSVTILLNGGAIAADDLQSSINEGRKIIVLAGTGRYADELASNPPDSSFYKIMQCDDGPGLKKELLDRLE
jgi:hypothetical protein